MIKLFQIGGFCFQIISDETITIPENFLKFQVTDAKNVSFCYRFFLSDRIDMPEEEALTIRDNLIVYKTMHGEERLMSIKGKQIYANYREKDIHSAEIVVNKEVLEHPEDTLFASLFALERRLIAYGALIFHCAYIEYHKKAILFSAPSGVGKSTQAELWEHYLGSQTINGDRALLRKKNGTWYACGWPVCGSSGICKRTDVPIHAIVMLQQGKENQVVRLSPGKAFGQIYPQITINQWNPAFVQAAMNGIEDLILQVPVWELTCDISEGAVQCLKDVLFPNHTERKD